MANRVEPIYPPGAGHWVFEAPTGELVVWYAYRTPGGRSYRWQGSQMNLTPLQMGLSGHKLLRRFDQDLIKAGVDRLRALDHHKTLPNDKFADIKNGKVLLDWPEIRRRAASDEQLSGTAKVLCEAFMDGMRWAKVVADGVH